MDKKKILALIPARGGSKRIPRKNTVRLCGKPLIAYTIEAALEAQRKGILSRVIVSTDDADIAETARKYGAEVPFIRPAEYSSDTATDTDVCRHAVQELVRQGWQVDVIVILRPTQPLRVVEDIEAAVSRFFKIKCDSVRSLTKAEHHPNWMKVLKGDYAVPLLKLKKSEEKVRSQDLMPVYRLNGIVDVIDVRNLKTDSLYGKKMSYILIDSFRSADIDTAEDLFVTECKLVYMKKHGKR